MIILTNLDNQQEVVYSCDPRLALPTDQDVANLWAQVPVRPLSLDEIALGGERGAGGLTREVDRPLPSNPLPMRCHCS